MIRTLSLFLISCAFASAAFAVPSVKTTDDIRFEIQAAALGTSNKTKYISLDFVLSNESDTRKVAFDERFDYILSDEFDNHYRRLPKPGSYPDPLEEKPSNFPSIYPGESCTKILFFEAPVAKAERLSLEIKGPLDGATNSLAIDFPAPRPAPEGPSVIEITSPENGTVVTATEMFPLNVKVNSDELPFKIIIVAFAKTLEDPAPSQNNTYNITIPAETPEGPSSISIIGYWTDPNGRKQVLSENIIIYVNPAPPASS
jgi:hypothetical protein